MSNEQLAISNDSQTRKMKYSGVEWIGNIPEEWSLSRFKDHYKNVKEIAGENASEYERLALTLNGVIKRAKDDSEGLQPKAFDGYQILRENDFIFKMIDLQNISTSRVGLSPYTGLVSPAYIRFTPRKEKQNNKFTYYFLMSMYYNCVFNNLGGDGVRSALNASDMGVLIIPFPSKKEQQTIADILDRKCTQIDALIANEEQQIAKLKAYKQSVITETVTKGLDPDVAMKDSGVEWIGEIPINFAMKRMKNIGTCRNGLTYSPENLTDENGVLVLRSSNVQNGRLCFEDNVYVDCAIKDDLMVKKGDILICSRNGSRALIGKSAIINLDINASFGAFMMIFRSNYNPKYIYYILNSNIFTYYLGTYLTATINQLTGTNFNGMVVPFCENDTTQAQIVSFLDSKCSQIDRLISIKQHKIEKLQQYKKSLIYEYVTGKKEVI